MQIPALWPLFSFSRNEYS